MAFSKAPSVSTRQSQEVKLLWSLDNRETDVDTDVIAKNGFFDLIKNPATKDDRYIFNKREGVAEYSTTLPTAALRGMHYWEDEDKLLVVAGNTVYIFTGSTGAFVVSILAFLTTTGEVSTTEFHYDDGSTKVVMGDGSRLITIDASNTMVASADADLPTPFKPSLLFLDGYLFLIKDGTSDIYNSNLNDPLAFTPGDFITAEMIPDTMLKLARLSNYLVAFGTNSVEYFFDAGNASGSPLQRNDTPVKHVGYLGGFATYENRIFFVGSSQTTAPVLYVLEDFKMETVENPIIKRQLQTGGDYVGTIVSNGGHSFYVLTVNDKTFVLDIDTKVWTRWSYQNTEKLECFNAVMVPLVSGGYCSVFFIEGLPDIYCFKPETYLDNTVVFPVVCQTPKQRFDTIREKYMNRILPVTDKTVGSLVIDWTDDDYATYSTPRSVDLSIEKPLLHRAGRFVERALRFKLESSTSFRMYYVEIDYNLGLK